MAQTQLRFNESLDPVTSSTLSSLHDSGRGWSEGDSLIGRLCSTRVGGWVLSDWLTQNDHVTRPVGSPTHAGPLQPIPMIVPTWSTPDTGLETCFLTVRQPGAVLFGRSTSPYAHALCPGHFSRPRQKQVLDPWRVGNKSLTAKQKAAASL